MRALPVVAWLAIAAGGADAAFAADRCGPVGFPPGKYATGAVRCCGGAGGACLSEDAGGCFPHDAPYADAAALCDGKGLRLCNFEELIGCCGTGCESDEYAAWYDNCRGHTCVHGSCHAIAFSFVCECEPGYGGQLCDEVAVTPAPSFLSGGVHYTADTCGKLDVAHHSSVAGAVSCCSLDGSSCIRRYNGCMGDMVSFGAAVEKCAASGHRLCTLSELETEVCCGTGCGYDSDPTWYDNCQGHQCAHGICVQQALSYACECETGYFGVFCDRDVPPETQMPTPAPQPVATPPPAGAAGWVTDGCGGEDSPTEVSTYGAVRCCSMDGTECTSDKRTGFCLGDSETFEMASALCAADGRRLCSYAEHHSGLCCFSGCGYDRMAIWYDNCAQNECVHGTCRTSEAAYYCACEGGYTGTYCDVKLTGDAWVQGRISELDKVVAQLKETASEASVVNGKLKGAVAAMGRQLIATEQRTAERLREQGNSGLTMVRSYNQGTDAYHQPSYTGSGAASMHNHANTHHTIGMGEFGAVLNGVQFTTRHNDYSLLENDDSVTPAEHVSEWPPAPKDIEQPSVPPSVLNAGSVEQQTAEMREYFRAFKEQDTSIRDYRPYFPAVLSYLEGTWVEASSDIDEPFSSERHHVDAESWSDLNDKLNFLFNNGQKNNEENLPYLPTAFRGMRSDGENTFEPVMAQWFYRISCKKLKDDVPTSRFRVRNDLHVQMRESTPATREKLSKTARASFDVNPTLQKDYDPKSAWPKKQTRTEYLDELMSQISGFDGPNANLTDDSFGATTTEYRSRDRMNTAFYSRFYSTSQIDAMGRTDKKRSFNDLLFAAQTTHRRVSPQSVCDDKYASHPDDDEREDICGSLGSQSLCAAHPGWSADEVDGATSGAKCTWWSRRDECQYRKCWEQRWSYAIPLEVVYLTPLHAWNPYNIEYHAEDPKIVERTGGKGTASRPYNGTNKDLYFRTPAGFYGDLDDVDAADTSGGTTYVLDKNGVSRAVRATGHWIHIPELGDLGSIRQRYPVFPVHEHGSMIYKEVKALEELVVGTSSEAISAIIGETQAAAYGVNLELVTAGSVYNRHGEVSRLTLEVPASIRLLMEEVQKRLPADAHVPSETW
eukprot:gene11400-17544_t